MFEQPYMVLKKNAKQEICLQVIQDWETQRYVKELEQAGCLRVGDEDGAVAAQFAAERLAGKVNAVANIFNALSVEGLPEPPEDAEPEAPDDKEEWQEPLPTAEDLDIALTDV